MPDFTAHKHPVLAVPCSDCQATAGSWCKRPSGHRATELHRTRKTAADHAFVVQHGPGAEIRYDQDLGCWEIENADICTEPAH